MPSEPLGVPEGLPTQFVNVQGGFARLCEFLAILNRNHKQAIFDYVKLTKPELKAGLSPNLPSSKRLQELITRYYKSPHARRERWRELTSFSGDEPLSTVPCLEDRALHGYDKDYRDLMIDETRLDDAWADFPGAVVPIADTPEWQHPALAIWPDLRHKVIEWDSLGTNDRDAAVLALFAVATILDDVRILRWAADRTSALTEEFAFALDRQAVMSDLRADTPDSAEDEDLMFRWQATCEVVADLASRLREDTADLQYYCELRRHMRVLDELYEPLSAVIKERAPENQIKRVIGTVESLAAEHDAPWLRSAVNSIEAQWTATYLRANCLNTKHLAEDVERAGRELKDSIVDWRAAEAEKQDLNNELNGLGTVAGEDIKSQLEAEAREEELHRSLATVSARALRAKRGVLDVAVPKSEDFDPARTDEGKRPATADAKKERASPMLAAASDRADDDDQVGRPKDYEREAVCAETEAAEVPISATPVGTENLQNTEDEDRTPTESSDGVTTTPEDGREEQPAKPARMPGSASEELSTESPWPDDSAVTALWRSMNDRPGIAYHIARLLSEQGSNNPALPPADLIAALILTDHVQAADDGIVEALKGRFELLDPSGLTCEDQHVQTSLNLLLFSCTLRPALLVPSTGAASLLRRICTPEILSPVHDLATAIAEHSERLEHSVGLDPSLFTAALSHADLAERLTGLQARVTDWIGKARRQRIIFGPANRVWHHWLRKTGCLDVLATLIAVGDSDRKDVERLREKLLDKRKFRDLVKEADVDIRGRKGGSIGGRALPQLQQHARPLIDMAGEWLRLVEARPNSRSFIERNLDSLRRTVRDGGRLADAAISRAAAAQTSEPLRVALAHAHKAVETLGRLFDTDTLADVRLFESPDTILSRDLLYVTGVKIETLHQPVGGDDPIKILSMLASVADHAATMRAAYDARFRQGDLTGASFAYRDMEATDDTDVGIDECRALLEKEVRRRQIALNSELTTLRHDLEQAFCVGQLVEETAAPLRAELVAAESAIYSCSVPDAIAGPRAIGVAEAKVEKIRQSIAYCRAKGKADARVKFEPLAADCRADDRARIEQAIVSGDLLTANELISRVETGEPLDDPRGTEVDDPFREFMTAVDGIEQSIGSVNRPSPDTIVAATRKRHAVAGVRFDTLSESEAERAGELLEAWYALSRGKQFKKSPVEDLLSLFGWSVRKTTLREKGRDWADVELETEPSQDRSRCPLPQFGSEARGRYRLLLDWGLSASESVAQHMGNGQNAPTIVLHFGQLGTDREQLRRWAVTMHRLFLVVDEALVLFLSARLSGRLSALFRCTLPFTDAEPYVTTSGLVPPELFFGRARERRRIMDPLGACFIYGGRQLGKTALLRSVEQEFHRPEKRQIAKWIDLKAREIGHARRPEEIWPLLWRELLSVDVLRRQDVPNEPNPENRTHIDKLIRAIEQWTKGEGEPRLLLLLDEADAFLEADARKDFSESTKLKGLMDRTDRRLKVVFAGLHNVLRMTERANHPLAHLGDPINVGPLLSNGEWEQAQDLVREPLRSVGYRFEPRDLSTLILAQTNYYPSLIQLYGAELVRRLRDTGRPVPYELGDEDISSAYRSEALRNAIRERFLLTLQLDQRYEVIAYALAFELLDSEQSLGYGLVRRDIAEYAKAWWPDGFQDDDREFNVLLQEMEGLGVLRSTDSGRRYTLRNPNVLLLLGNRDDIHQVLEKQREAPKKFEPASFHARYPDDSEGSARRGPLTYEQESMLRATSGVAVVCGCQAADVAQVRDFLYKRIEKTSYREFPDCADVRQFRQNLMNLQPRSTNVITVVLIPYQREWNAEWLEVAESALRRKKTGRWIKVLFVADPETLWRVMDEAREKKNEVDWVSIGLWDEVFLRHWLGDNNLPHGAEEVSGLMKISGGWPMLLEKFVEPQQEDWEGRMERLRSDVRRDADEWLLRLGITPAVKSALGMLLRHGPIRAESQADIESLASLEDVDSGRLRARIAWSERLGIVSRSDGEWTFNPLLRELLGHGAGR